MFRIATSKVVNQVAKGGLRHTVRHHQFSTGGAQFKTSGKSRSVAIGVSALALGSAFAYNEVGAAANGVADFNKVRADIVNLLDDENAKNPSVDGASNGGGGAILSDASSPGMALLRHVVQDR